MRKKKVNRTKEFEEFKSFMSRYPKDFILLKLFNLSKDYQDCLDGKNKKNRGAPKLSDRYKIHFCLEMKRISKRIKSNVISRCAKEMMDSGFLLKLDKSEKTDANKKSNEIDVAKRYRAFIKEFNEGKILYAERQKDSSKIDILDPRSKRFISKLIIEK